MGTEDTGISQEAQARHRISELEAQVAQAAGAAKDALLVARLTQQFTKQGVAYPYDLAVRAQSAFVDVTPQTTDVDLATRATTWYESERSLFAAAAPSVEAPAAPPPPAQAPFGGAQPNLTSPGLPPKAAPVVVGSPEYYEQGWAKKPMSEQIAAMKGDSPALVSSEKVKLQQQEPGFLR